MDNMHDSEYRIVVRLYVIEELMSDGLWKRRKDFPINEFDKALIYLNLRRSEMAYPKCTYRFVLLEEVRTVLKVGTTKDF
jgi:hypothetical protein